MPQLNAANPLSTCTDYLKVTEGDKVSWPWRTALEWNVKSPYRKSIQQILKSQHLV